MRVLVACALLVLGCGGLPEPSLPLARTPDADFRRSAPPALAKASELRLPKPETRSLKNGLLVAVVSRKELPLASAVLVVRDAGLGSDLPDPAVALVTAHAVIDPPEEIMNAVTSREAAFLGFTSSREQFTRTTEIFAAAVRNPGFTEATLETARRTATDDIAGDDYILELISNRLLYEQPPPVLQSETAGIQNIGRVSLVDFHRDHYRPEASALIVVGALEPTEVFALAERLFGDWTAASPAQRRGAPTLPKLVERVGLRPISALDARVEIAHARFAIPGPPDGAAELPAFELLGATLGGSFSSRGNSSLRVHDATSYGVSAEVNNHRDGSELVIEFSARKSELVGGIGRMLGEIERLRHEPLSTAELEHTKTIWQANVAGLLSNNGATAYLLAWRFALGADPTEVDAYLTSVMKTNATELLAVARTAFAPNRIQIAVIGDSNVIGVPLRRLSRLVWQQSP